MPHDISADITADVNQYFKVPFNKTLTFNLAKHINFKVEFDIYIYMPMKTYV